MFSRKKIRFFGTCILCAGLYTSFVMQLFWQKNILLSALLFCLLFVGLIFWAIDMRKLPQGWIWLGLLLLGGGI
ncbi:MAG: hypothetical protein Q4B28_08265 [bacterium]|nr:hypothetical protein [bacterium]